MEGNNVACYDVNILQQILNKEIRLYDTQQQQQQQRQQQQEQ